MGDASCLRVQDIEHVCVVSFKDASILDALTIQRIGNELYNLIEEQGRKTLLLDFSDVRFMSSQALGVIIRLRTKADKVAAKIALASIRPELIRVFKITNLDRLFVFHATRDEGLLKFGVTPPPKAQATPPKK